MEDSSNRLRARMRAKPFAVWVLFGALLSVGLSIIPVAVQFSGGGSIAFVVPFILIPIAVAFAVLTGKRWSFAVAAVVSVLFFVLFASYSPGILANPGDPSYWFAISSLSALLLAAIFSVLALASVKGGIERKPFLSSPMSSGGLFTFAVIGFVIGAVITGTLAGVVVTRLLAGSTIADVRIVQGAAGASEPYSPRSFAVVHGGGVTWYNQDATQHTVTSNVSGQFDSGLLDAGVRWSHVFAQPGNYSYYCTLHLQMTGTIVVS